MSVAGQSGPATSESDGRTSWTFDTYTPQTERRESLIVPLDARLRDVRQAPDGTIYIAVERDRQLRPGSTKLTPTGRSCDSPRLSS